MAKKGFVVGMLAVLLSLAFVFSSCASAATIGLLSPAPAIELNSTTISVAKTGTGGV